MSRARHNTRFAGSLLAALLAGAGASHARAETVAYPLSIVTNTQSEEGSRLAYRIREHAKASTSFRVVDPGSDGFKLHVAVMDLTDAEAYSLAVTFIVTDQDGKTEYFVSSSVGYCSKDNYDACADTALAYTSEEAEGLVGAMADLVRKSQGLH